MAARAAAGEVGAKAMSKPIDDEDLWGGPPAPRPVVEHTSGYVREVTHGHEWTGMYLPDGSRYEMCGHCCAVRTSNDDSDLWPSMREAAL